MGYKIIKTNEKKFTFSVIGSIFIYVFVISLLVICFIKGITLIVIAHQYNNPINYIAAAGTFFVGATAGVIQLIILCKNSSLAKKERIKFTISLFEKYQSILKLTDSFVTLYTDMINCLKFNNADLSNKEVVSAIYTINLFKRRILKEPYTKLSQMKHKVQEILDDMQSVSIDINNWEMSGQVDKKMFEKILSPYKNKFKMIDKIKDIFYE